MLFKADEPNARPSLQVEGPAEPFARLIAHLLAYKIWIVGAAVLGLVVSGVALCFMTPRYEAEAVVIVDSRRNKLADAESALSSIVVDQYQSALKSELDLMVSPDLARHVITSLGLLQTPDYLSARTHVSTASRFEALRNQLLRQVQATLAVVGLQVPAHHLPAEEASAQPPAAADDPQDAVMSNAVKIFGKLFWALNDPKSLTIRIGYRSTSPELAAAATNAVLHRYLAQDEEMKAAAAARSQAWLKERIATLRADLDTTERADEEFRASHDLATVRDRSPLQQALLQLEGQRVSTQTLLSAAQSKVDRDRQSGGIAAQATGSDVLASRLIQGLRQQEAGLTAEQAQLSATRLPSDPSMIKIAGELAGVRTAIHDEVQRMVQANLSDLRIAQSGLTNIDGQIAAMQAKINVANAADIKLRSLEADAASKRAVLNTFAERYDQDGGVPLTPPDGRVVSWATVPVDASSPQYGLVLVGGTLGFAFLAFCVSLALERLRHGFGGMQQLEEELGLVVAGLTLEQSGRRKSLQRALRAAEPSPIRDLAVTVRALAHTPGQGNTDNKVVLVTSAVAGEGKSTVALSLARSVANAGQRCLLIDADIRNPSLHGALGVPATPGLVELTVDRATIGAATREVAGERFDFLSAGRPLADPLSLFTNDGFGNALAEFKRIYDVIVIDSAPVLVASEALVLVGAADLTLFLVKWRTTPRDIARKAASLITRCSSGPCLTVLSQVNLRRMRRSGGRHMEEYYRDAYRVSRAA